MAAAQRVAAGGTPYQPETLDGPFSAGPGGLYLYAPPLAALLAPISGLPFEALAAGWWILRVAALAGACALLPAPTWVRGALLGVAAISYPVLIDLNLGNVSLVVLLLTVCAWRWLDRPAGSIAVALALALRPTLVVLPIWSLLRRQWRRSGLDRRGGPGVILLSLPLVGLGAYRGLPDRRAQPERPDRRGPQRRPGLRGPALGLCPSWPGWRSGQLRASAWSPSGWRLRRDRDTGFVMTVMASLLLAPLLWVHYLVALALPAALLAARGLPLGGAAAPAGLVARAPPAPCRPRGDVPAARRA